MTNTQKICYIIGSGDIYKYKLSPKEGDFIIAVDGGYDHLKRQKITPNFTIGDFDSIKGSLPKDNFKQLPRDKDDSDTLAALKYGIKLGYKTFYIYGGSGGDRFDHTFANIQCLTYLSKRGCRGLLFTKNEIITAITNDSLSYNEKCQGMISIFAYSPKAKGITVQGLKYTLADDSLSSDFPKGLSNEFIGKSSSISVKSGTLIVISRHLPEARIALSSPENQKTRSK